MPIIRDPKMNPRERDFGIVFIHELGGNFKYEKTRNQNRLLVAGSIVNFDIEKDNSITYYHVVRTIDGMPIIGEIKGKLDEVTDGDNAPVVDFLKDNGTSELGANLDEIMRGKSDLII